MTYELNEGLKRNMAEKENKSNKTPARPQENCREAGGNNENVAISKEEYEKLKACAREAAELQDKLLRAHAEFENAKKRLEKDKIDYLKFANDGFLLEFLPILDSLEIAEKHIKEAKDFKAVQEGVDMIQLQIQKFLKDIGVEKVKTVGEKFDPHVHEAVETKEAKDKEDGLILGELKPGYRVNGRLLRPAFVQIVKSRQTTL